MREFQETQFDQRLWEIYLWAMFRDQGYDVSHQQAPDLLLKSPLHSFSVEATTVAPSQAGPLALHPNPSSPEELVEFLTDFMPMKFGSSLTSKLYKADANGLRYWQKPGARDLPFVIAIADFHKSADGAQLGSMTYSQGALHAYLYGRRVSAELVDGRIVYRHAPVTEHTYNGKTVPSGFFDLPEAENVSAVLFSNAATLAKFDRMGVLAGFAPPQHKYIRQGFRYDPDPEAVRGIPFQVEVGACGYEESWGDEVQVFHNPRALRPLDPAAFPDATQLSYIDGEFVGIAQEGQILSSFTVVLTPELSRAPRDA